jgi:beta-lactamase regulating signal transducer with metallopeptidase domain
MMTTWFADSTAATVLWLIVKATALVGVAAIVQILLMRRASAAARHLLWMAVLVCLLGLPGAARFLPSWPVSVGVTPLAGSDQPPLKLRRSAGALAKAEDPALHVQARPVVPLALESPGLSTASGTASVEATATASRVSKEPRSLVSIAAWIYAAGVIVLVMYWFAERWQVRRFIRHAEVIDDREWTGTFSECTRAIGIVRSVRLLKSRERNVPLAFGTRRPAVIVPSIAETWDEDRRRAVLLHELAHVARFDCLTHTVALTACAMYWFHPAVWWVAKRIRIERELACDDRVIAAGAEPREYASHLLEIAYSFGGRRAPALAVCMARPRQLEGRMLAALDAARNRRRPSTRTRIAAAAIAVVVLAGLAAARPVLTRASEPSPAAEEQQWPRLPDARETVHSAKTAVEQDVKAIAHLPLDGLNEVRGAIRAVASAVRVQQENLPGTWEIRPTDTKGMVHLRIVERNSSSGTNVPIEQLEGLTGAQLTGTGGPVQFKVRRDAGTFNFEGVIRSGVGAGTFTFTADAAFPAEMVKRGFARPTPEQQYEMARHDIGYAFVEELTKQGYGRPQTAELVRAGQHGVQATYLREMGALGYRLSTLDALITLRDHGVTPSYVRELTDNGYKGLSADTIREARDHGITPDYVRAMRDAGYTSVPMEELIKVRDHGVTAEYVRGLGEAGYKKLPLEEVVRVRDHGVTTEYVRDMRQLGYSLSIDDLVRARDHGVTIEYVREMASLGYGGQPIDALIRVRDHGVTADYAKDVKALGYDKVTVDDLVTLRDHGLTAERIRSANARAGTRLPIDMLKSLAAGGMR